MYRDRFTVVAGRMALGLMTAGISACGGGGGGGGTAAPAELATLDSGNADTIVREVLGAGFDSSDFGTAVSGGGILSTDGGSNALAVRMATRRTIQAAGDTSSQAAGNAQPSDSYGPERSDCQVSGSVTLSATLASTETLSAGDQITAIFASCNDGDGAVYNGRMRIDVLGFAGDLYGELYQLNSRLTLTNLAITEDGITDTGNGTLNVNMNLLTPDLDLYSISTSRFELASGDNSWIFHDVVSTSEDDHRGSGWLITLSESGSLESSSFAGRVDYGTTTPFQSVNGNPPAAGVLRIGGANGSSILVTALNEADLQLAIDWNGDTVVDETRLMAWDTVPGW